jgi:hypothetical protein
MFSRKRLIATGLVAAIGAFSAVGIASASTTVDIDQSNGVAPSKLSKTSFKATSLNVVVNSDTDNANGVPDPVTNAKLSFDDDVKISTKGIKTCNANLANTTTAQAKAACGKAQVGSGAANVLIPAGPSGPPSQFTAVITAFNGPKQGGKPTLILHGRVDALGVTQILTGKIDSQGATGDYGTTLNVPITPLPAGAQLQRFEVTVKKGNYITARCHDANKKLNMKGQFAVGGSGPASQSDTTAQTCSIKR